MQVAARQGNAEAQEILGIIELPEAADQRHDLPHKIDMMANEKRLSLYQKAKMNDHNAQIVLACCVLSARTHVAHTYQDLESTNTYCNSTAMDWLQRAAKLGNDEAQELLSAISSDSEDEEKDLGTSLIISILKKEEEEEVALSASGFSAAQIAVLQGLQQRAASQTKTHQN